MKAMPLPFEDFQGKGVLDFSSCSSSPDSFPHLLLNQKWHNSSKDNCCYVVGSEPTSVLDARRSPSPPTSSSTLSSSQGATASGGASTETTTNNTAGVPPAGPLSVDTSTTKCGQQQLGMEDWEGVLPGSPSQEQEQSILRLIMGDIEDPSVGLNKLLQSGGSGPSHHDTEFNAGFGAVDQGFGFEPMNSGSLVSSIDPATTAASEFPLLLSHNARIGSLLNQTHQNPGQALCGSSSSAGSNLFQSVFQHQQQQPFEDTEVKPQIFNPQMLLNQNQAHFSQNPTMFFPLPYPQLHEHHHNFLSPPPPKRLNTGPAGTNFPVQKHPFPDSRPELFLQRQQQQLQMLQQQRPALMKQKIMTDELAAQQLQQAVINPICQAAELIETGNPALAQGILARLNHQLSLSIGKPHIRAAFYFKEALQLLLNDGTAANPSSMSPCYLIFKIGAFKSYSEISPILQFSNFTCNQALLEACEGSDRIHVIDFDIGFGGQWASFMQELALRNGGVPSLKITAFASPSSSHDEVELGFTRENLTTFASELNMPFELDILSLEALSSGSWPMPIQVSEKEALAVNLPVGAFSNYPSSLPVVLLVLKQLAPKIVVSLDRGCDRTDLPFAHHVNHSIQSYSGLLECIEAVNMNMDALQKIERFLVQPAIEKLVLGRHQHLDRTLPWRTLFLQSGFTPLQFSNFAESQAECLVQRTPVRGFHIEKRQSSLALCWQQKELISASAWRC